MDHADLDVSEGQLAKLVDDLDEMQGYLERQTKHMDQIVDSVAAGWRGTTASVYRELHKGVAEDAVRIRQVLILIEEATRLGKDGFSEQELDTLQRLRKMQDSEDVATEARAMSESGPPTGAESPRSRILDV
ncbi:WXG100 family type VII secretion target [Streptomyces sp. A3M-1-3]|uniref:WXG100 family type VII secretion target n=1 Tax=Streptomyces sp. A3M-1-3 TaxID=2962044 RepID=UPI0020B8873B|nr:WXG100 family type VII secretion target [Streptomyces sp. A3M-1-3]MCP3818851.1 WXG100 family type VII secretion target [Streptomyces sp. A3M-1-3]